MTYLCGIYRSKNTLKRPEFEMVLLNLETDKGLNDIKIMMK